MKIIVIGSGMSGLTAAAYLSKSEHEVIVYEQFPEIGGVTATHRQDSFGWDLGPLLLEGFLPGEPANRILRELGVENKVSVQRYDRGISYPDFALWKPEEYQGPYWRRDYLKSRFPAESDGLDLYYNFYDDFCKLIRYDGRLANSSGLNALLIKLKMWLAYRKIKHMENWSAKQLMDLFFQGPELKALYTGILADFVVKPSQFPAFGVPMSNLETAFDLRTPLDDERGSLPGYSYILGGCCKLVEAVAGVIEQNRGLIQTSTTVNKIQIENGRATGVILQDGHFEPADLIVSSGGAKETFLSMIGNEHLPKEFLSQVSGLIPMQSVFMVHLGIDFDPGKYQPAALCYYYKIYDIEKAVKDCQEGHYHEGEDGFLIYVPSQHSPDLSTSNHHAVTVYTIAPNYLDNGSWSDRREELADKLIAEAEKFVPGLKKGTVTRCIMTPDDFRERTHQPNHHSFGGLAPVMGQQSPPFKSPVEDFWFIGAQSESGGGVKGVIVGAEKAVRQIQATIKGR
ncbi:NAD(P)/FAD-dependent oxidoreductase [bacterium]|nr:NAD(P)/FAD-dependent oxidoreductase [bacterium]